VTSSQPPDTPDKGRRPSWVWTVLPLNAGVQGFLTLVPLYILYLGGNVVQVALFTTFYNAVLIPFSIFWGRETDRIPKRRIYFVITCAGSTAIFVGMYFLRDLYELAILYAALGIVVSANGVATNLLVMETSEKKNWISAYSRLALVSNLGSIIGIAVGFVWSSTLPLDAFLLFCGAATALSVLLSYLLISEPKMLLESSHLSLSHANYPVRIYHSMSFLFHHMVVSRGMVKDVVKVAKATRAGALTGRSLLFLSSFLFTTASAFLNTSFTPFLVAYSVTDNEVFAISLINVAVQTLIYRSMGSLVKRFGGASVGPNAVVLRTLMYMVLAGAALAVHGTDLFLLTSVVYALIGTMFAFWNSSTSVTLLSNLGQGRQGNLLGAYAALGALGTVAGSLFTGYISFYDGYSTTFAVAAAILLVSFFTLEAALKSLGYTKQPSTVS
jgi:MFS family permease